MAQLASAMANHIVPWEHIRALMASRLIALDKCLGVLVKCLRRKFQTGGWCRGITFDSHLKGRGFNSPFVHFDDFTESEEDRAAAAAGILRRLARQRARGAEQQPVAGQMGAHGLAAAATPVPAPAWTAARAGGSSRCSPRKCRGWLRLAGRDEGPERADDYVLLGNDAAGPGGEEPEGARAGTRSPAGCSCGRMGSTTCSRGGGGARQRVAHHAPRQGAVRHRGREQGA